MRGAGLASGLRRATSPLVQPTRARIFSEKALLKAAPASFSTFTARRAELEPFEAAPPINFGSDDQVPAILKKVRVIPASPSYFTAKPSFIDGILELKAILRKYETLPQIEPIHAPRVAWKSLEDFKSAAGDEPIKIAQWRKLQKVLQRLNYIHPTIMPDEVKQVMDKYKRAINPYDRKPSPKVLDEMGRGMGVGRRKTCSAVAWVVEGEGEVLINGKTLTETFKRIHDRESALWALKATQRLDKYNVWALIRGGGTTGQAEALTLAIARALMVHEPALKPALRRAGCVTRDPRKVERKKPGHIKARKMPTWVKR